MKSWLSITCIFAASLALLLAVSVVAQGQSLPHQASAGQMASDQATNQPRTQHIELAGQFGGSAYAVAKQGSYAYLGVGPRLVVLDVSNPVTPTLVGQTDALPDIVESIAVVGGYAYVANGRGGLRIVSVADPAHPAEIGFLDTFSSSVDVMFSTTDVAVVGDYAYVANNSAGLHIVNVADPAHPVPVGHHSIEIGPPAFIMRASRVTVVGNYAYVAQGNWGGGLHIVDVSDPAHPRQQSFTRLDFTSDVVVSGTYAYVADYLEGLHVFDVSDPAHPVEVYSDLTWWRNYSLTIANGHLYAVSDKGDLSIFDISDPSRLRDAGSYDTPGSSQDVAVDGGYAYVADEEGGLQIVDVADVARPYNVGYLSIPETLGESIAVAGNYAYLATQTGLYVVDVITPSLPSQTGWLTTTGGYIYDVAALGDYAYLVDGNGLHIANVANPAHPSEVGAYDTPGIAYGVSVSGNLAYLADWSGSLHIVSVVSPTHPLPVGRYDFSGNATDVAVAGDYAYVADGGGWLRTINVTDPAHPFEAGSIQVPSARRLRVVGDYAYVVASEVGLYIVDVADPAQPSVAGFYEYHYAYDADVVGDYAYVTAPPAYAMHIVNVADPANPSFVDLYRAEVWGITVVGDFVYAGKGGGLEIIHVTGLKQPSEVGVFETPFRPYVLDVAGDRAYLGSENDGLHTFDLSDPAHPTQVGFTTTLGSDVVVRGNYAYLVAGGWNNSRIVDVSDPSNLSQVASLTGGSIALAGDYAYTGESNRFYVWSVADPFSPTLLGFVDPSTTIINDVAANGNYSYAVTDYGLHVIDVTTPTQPSPVISTSIPNARKVEVQGDYAYVLDVNGFHVINVADPAQPSEVGLAYLSPSWYCSDLSISGDYAYVTCEDNLHLISIFDPAHPIVVDSYGIPGNALDVDVLRDHIYVACEGGGLVILRFAPSVTAVIPTAGGSLTSAIDDTVYQCTAGAFTDTVIVTHTYRYPVTCPPPDSNHIGVGHCFGIAAVYSGTGQPAELAPGQVCTITVHYTDAEEGPAIEDTLTLYRWDGSQCGLPRGSRRRWMQTPTRSSLRWLTFPCGQYWERRTVCSCLL